MDCGWGIPNITQVVSLNLTNSSVTQYLVTKFFLHISHVQSTTKQKKQVKCVSKDSKLESIIFFFSDQALFKDGGDISR